MLIETLKNHASARRMDIALQGRDIGLTYQQLFVEVTRLQTQFSQYLSNAKPVMALALDNHPAWVIVDLAAMASKLPLVPLPLFFSNAQILHALGDAGANMLICDNPQFFSEILGDIIISQSELTIANKKLSLLHLTIAPKKLPKDTAKITYTSGTTGAPKGVCLSNDSMLSVANAIKTATNLSVQDVHLCVLPLSTLLENVAGVYASLLAGATAHILPSEQVGLQGSSLNIQQLYKTLTNTKANTIILIPQLLSALVLACEGGVKLPHLRFLAVGGAHVSKNLLERAKRLDLPVFEGYGLSESASVVALNTPNARKIGSVGKPLPHIAIQFSEDNEILVKGSNLLGYTGEKFDAVNAEMTGAEVRNEFIKTGDIGYMDDDGFLFINGRKKNIFITSFGRNVSPEWVESSLLNSPYILQACVFGEAKPFNVAVIVTKPDSTPILIYKAIEAINQLLPDYARISKWVLADAPFAVKNGQLTPNGRLKRDAILQTYQQKINDLYKETA